jgi:hypothetical protein
VVQLSQEFAELGRQLHGPGDDQAACSGRCNSPSNTSTRAPEPASPKSAAWRGTSLAASNPVAARADSLQYQLNERPCLGSARLDTNYLLFDVATRHPLARFSAALMEHTPYRSVLSLQLPAEEAAALNLFADRPGALTDAHIDTAAILAARISTLVALHKAEGHATHLHTALQTNREIGAAIGVLMAHYKITEPAAFELLRAASQTLHRKLPDIATDVVETGTLPDQPSHPPAALAAAQQPNNRNRPTNATTRVEHPIHHSRYPRPSGTLTGPKELAALQSHPHHHAQTLNIHTMATLPTG